MSAPLIVSRWINPLLRRHISLPKRSYTTEAENPRHSLGDWYRGSIVGHTIVGGLVGSVYLPVYLWENICGDIRESKSTVSNTEFVFGSLLWAPAGILTGASAGFFIGLTTPISYLAAGTCLWYRNKK